MRLSARLCDRMVDLGRSYSHSGGPPWSFREVALHWGPTTAHTRSGPRPEVRWVISSRVTHTPQTHSGFGRTSPIGGPTQMITLWDHNSS